MASYTKPLSPSETMQLFLTSGGGESSFVMKEGDRGSLAGYEQAREYGTYDDTHGNATIYINQDSPDSMYASKPFLINIENGASGTSWVKVFRKTVTPFSAVTLGSAWLWADGEAPTFVGGGLLVMAWTGSQGIVNYIFDGVDLSGQGGQSGGGMN